MNMKIVTRGLVAILLLIGFCIGYARAQRGVPVRAPAFRPAPLPHIFPHGGAHGHGAGGESEIDWVGTGLCIAGGVGVVGLGFFGVRAWRNRASRAVVIRIISTPPGEAPEEVRREWVGVELRLAAGETVARPMPGVGVVSNKVGQVSVGYIVDGNAAVTALASHSPSAAEWWRTNAGHVLSAGYKLQFAAEACELVS